MIRGIPYEACNEEKLNEYFKEAYPADNITHLTLAYNINQLQHCYKRRKLNLHISQQSKKMFDERVLLLRIFAATMPLLVSVISLLEKQWKKAALDKSMMIKLFVYLSMMILVLSSLRLIRYS
ncbi:unnamed protein product [Adineta steineri]|uniref:CSC1/OSCA1-like cytosolic domain-containing protein n=1 Tax=Adineta steineri TaxID=433720 RepID=A0A819UNM1_9BILA|nr:unnamed protein product [Adineta steineri]CAF4098750.1 unnamed protein product [Adineta steineri]